MSGAQPEIYSKSSEGKRVTLKFVENSLLLKCRNQLVYKI